MSNIIQFEILGGWPNDFGYGYPPDIQKLLMTQK